MARTRKEVTEQSPFLSAVAEVKPATRLWMVNVPVLSPSVKLVEPAHVTSNGLFSAYLAPPPLHVPRTRLSRQRRRRLP